MDDLEEEAFPGSPDEDEAEALHRSHWLWLPANPNYRYCKDCIYCAGTGTHTFCQYILLTGRMRPCKAGKDCTAKIKGKRLQEREFNYWGD